jgi:hypothetical protein
MQMQEADAKAEQILDEERLFPTVRYTTDAPVLNPAAPIAEAFSERGKHPRAVQPHPEKFIFASANFDLKCALLDQVQEADRSNVLRQCCREYPIERPIMTDPKMSGARELQAAARRSCLSL